MPTLRVHFLPELIADTDLSGSACVVIDVLRATTTTVYALAAGARGVMPCLTVDDARAAATALPKGDAVLGGERGGLAIAGFALGNSPAEYTPQSVGGKTLVLTTTNGTKALLQCSGARETLIGSFVNLAAIVGVLKSQPQVDLVCAGTDGRITREDVLLAGAIVASLAAEDDSPLDDQAAIARDAWLRIMAHAGAGDVKPRLVAAMRESRGGRNLIELGMEGDIVLAAQVDRFGVVPRFDRKSGQIVAADLP